MKNAAMENDTAVQDMFATDLILIDLYQQAWNNGTAAANVTSLRSDMETLAGYLSPNDTSIIPQDRKTVDPNSKDYYDDYFLQGVDSASSGKIRIVAKRRERRFLRSCNMLRTNERKRLREHGEAWRS